MSKIDENPIKVCIIDFMIIPCLPLEVTYVGSSLINLLNMGWVLILNWLMTCNMLMWVTDSNTNTLGDSGKWFERWFCDCLMLDLPKSTL
jgi:hypothetical protein